MAVKRIAIVGGGAKAAAIAAKAACLHEEYGVGLEVVIFEPHSLGSSWNGSCGYTDGKQLLCTPAERDVGFPYSFVEFGDRVATRMQNTYSWSAFLIQKGAYASWVDRGRASPPHSEFGEYLAYCIEKSGAKVVPARVERLKVSRKKWSISLAPDKGARQPVVRGFDAVVVTGPGPASSKINKINDRRIFNGVNFWRSLGSVEEYIKQSDDPIVIVGSGGTAAAIAGWLASRDFDNEIVIIGNQVALFARVDNAFENKAFTDQELWGSLSFKDRRSFTERLTRGAVWSNVTDVLAKARSISYVPGMAKGVSLARKNDPSSELQVSFNTSGNRKLSRKPACVVIEATGFNDAWFAQLLEEPLAKQMRDKKDQLQRNMDVHLALPLSNAPPLHAPMLSQVVSPAFTSLMALGAMADAILRPYVKP